MINRESSREVLSEITNRWSPRAFDAGRPVDDDDLLALLEAARFAPSCMNEQPWQYVVAQAPADHEKMVSVLNPANQEWASRAPVLMLILTRKNFSSGRGNRFHQFDAGTSWGFLQLEAQRRGLITHAMAGFNHDMARDVFAVPDDYEIMAAVAVGYYGNPEELSARYREREHPQPRKSLAEMFFRNE